MAEVIYPALLVTTDHKNASAVKQAIEAFAYKQFNKAINNRTNDELYQEPKAISFLINHEHPKEFGDKLKVEFANSGVGIETKIINSKEDFES